MESVTHKLNSLDEYVGYKNLRETKEEELLLSRIRMVRSALTQEYEKTMARLRKFERYCVLRHQLLRREQDEHLGKDVVPIEMVTEADMVVGRPTGPPNRIMSTIPEEYEEGGGAGEPEPPAPPPYHTDPHVEEEGGQGVGEEEGEEGGEEPYEEAEEGQGLIYK